MDDTYEYVELNIPTTVWKRIEGLAALSNPPMSGKDLVYGMLEAVAGRGVAAVREIMMTGSEVGHDGR